VPIGRPCGTLGVGTAAAVGTAACECSRRHTSRYRYSLGWYAGRTLTVIASAVVLIANLASFRKLKATAEFNASYDRLTALANRRSAHNSLDALVATAARMGRTLSVVMFDLDRFKQINDDHGHAAGDSVLRSVADTMRATVRNSDISARVGGEEFLLVRPDATLTDAWLIAERLRASMLGTVIGAIGSAVTGSFGVAMLRPGDSSADLLPRADQAMYTAKALGRDRLAVADEPLPDHARFSAQC
jgi:diguanylate cyclase (GGDEF)-like protein